jgi:hypothetical protein
LFWFICPSCARRKDLHIAALTNTLASAGPSHRKNLQNCKFISTSKLMRPKRNSTTSPAAHTAADGCSISGSMQRDPHHVQD